MSVTDTSRPMSRGLHSYTTCRYMQHPDCSRYTRQKKLLSHRKLLLGMSSCSKKWSGSRVVGVITVTHGLPLAVNKIHILLQSALYVAFNITVSAFFSTNGRILFILTNNILPFVEKNA